GEREGVRRDDAMVRLDVHEAARVEVLRVDDHAVDVGKDLVLVADTDIIAERRQAVADGTIAHLPLDERLDHAVLGGHAPDPAVAADAHVFDAFAAATRGWQRAARAAGNGGGK